MMRRMIASVVIGLALVLALMLFVDASMALQESGGKGTAQRPPRSDSLRLQVPARGEPVPSRALRRPVNLKGVIDQLPSDTLTGTWWIELASGDLMSVEVTSETRIVPPHVEPEEGDAVHVLATYEEEMLVAKQIVIKKGKQERMRPIHILGEITELPTPTGTITGTWVVNGFTVTVDSETKIHPRDRMPELGMWANVLAFRQDGTLLADKITLQLRGEAESEVELEGVIRQLPTDGLYGTWVVDEFSVTVTADTVLRGVTPTVGLNAEVEGELQGEKSILAHKIKVEAPERDVVELEGTVVLTDAIPGVWTIQTSESEEISVTITLSTCINERKGRLDLGSWVEVKAVQLDGTLEAIYIKVEDGPGEDREITFTGILEALPPAAPHAYNGPWTIVTDAMTVTVIATGQTEIEGEAEPGATVEVEGVLQRDGLVRAHSIAVIAPPPESE